MATDPRIQAALEAIEGAKFCAYCGGRIVSEAASVTGFFHFSEVEMRLLHDASDEQDPVYQMPAPVGENVLPAALRLLEAVLVPHDLRVCEYDMQDCWEWGTWRFATCIEDVDYRCEAHANEKPEWWDDEDDGEWQTQYERQPALINLVAAAAEFLALLPAVPEGETE